MPPATPTNAPLAHPLAPNPHTSVGLFWIYTDSSTGRQWKGGTYKVKRITGTGTPTTVIASGLTNADYQDTGLSAGTTYTYSFVANDGSDSGDSPTVTVTTEAADTSAVKFPNAIFEELLGPLIEEGQIPFAYYVTNMKARAQDIIAASPFTVPHDLQGTGAITNSTTTLTGTGTFFLEQADGTNAACANHIAINGVDAGTYTVNSNTSITLTTTWTGGTVSGATLSTNVPLCGYNDSFNDHYTSNQLWYYDAAQAMWQVYFMTGDPQYLRGAIRIAESVFAGQHWLGRNRDTGNDMPSPRNLQFGGRVLLGLAGRDDVWDWLDLYLTNRYPTWISNYRPSNGNNLFNREHAYMVQFTSWFIAAAPDSFKRSDGTVTSANGATTVDGSLATGRKGHWRDELDIDVPGLLAAAQGPEGNYRTFNLSGTYSEGDYPYPPGEGQPFMLGLYCDAMGYVWRNSRLASGTRDSARRQVLKGAAFMWSEGYNTNIIADDTSNRWRSVWYFADGGTRLNPFAFRYGGDSGLFNTVPYSSQVQNYRQSIPLMVSTFGWAYEMSGKTVYKTLGDEMANAAWAAVGENTGATGDGYKSLAHNTANYKDFGQSFRSSPKYFGMRLESPSSLGTPPVVTMPGNVTLTGSTNQVTLTASVSATNTPCTYRWSLREWPVQVSHYAAPPQFTDETSLTTEFIAGEPGTYKLIFYAIDSLGMFDYGTVNVTVGDGVFPPVVLIQKDEAIGYCMAGTSLATILVTAYSVAGRTLTHTFTGFGPKDQSAPTISPSGTTGNSITVTASGLSPGFWGFKDHVVDSAGASRDAFFIIACSSTTCSDRFSVPSTAHNTIPLVVKLPDVYTSATKTRLFVAPVEPEGWSKFNGPSTGYTQGPDAGGNYMPLALTHSWTQTSGPVSATITNSTTIRPDITGMTVAGTYTFQYSGTDQQGDSVVTSINVITTASGGGGGDPSVKLIAVCL